MKTVNQVRNKENYKLPHERDQSTDADGTGSGSSHEGSQRLLDQALKDIKRGVKDTDRGTPSDVPIRTKDKP
ncbi:MAG: hypothetical protein DID92_2727744128 [Candidatus Nitrotoga sp. SPKER]|nr:MAG: hypothetical protein DID92_2727744128 [Candidatus Nitrotoga sp. SPKER]